jgi:hypothetical protein
MEVNLIFKIHRKAKIEENPSKYLDADEEYKEYAREPRSIYWVTNKGKALSSNWSGIRVMNTQVANNSGRDAAKYVGVSATNIFRALNGIYKVVGGYRWKYKKSVLN